MKNNNYIIAVSLLLFVLSVILDLIFHLILGTQPITLKVFADPENLFHWSMLLVSFLTFGLVITFIVQRREAAEKALSSETAARKQMIEEMTKLKLGIERSHEAIFITDTEGKITYLNPAFETLYGFSRNEVIGQTPRIIKSGTLAPDVYQNFWKTLLDKQVISGEIINKTKDGRLLNIEGTALAILNDKEETVGFMGIQHDITQLKKNEQELKDKISELQQLYDAASGREIKMDQLEKELEKLKKTSN